MHNYSGTALQDTVKPPNKGDGPFVSCREVVLFSEVSLKPIEKFLKTQKTLKVFEMYYYNITNYSKHILIT